MRHPGLIPPHAWPSHTPYLQSSPSLNTPNLSVGFPARIARDAIVCLQGWIDSPSDVQSFRAKGTVSCLLQSLLIDIKDRELCLPSGIILSISSSSRLDWYYQLWHRRPPDSPLPLSTNADLGRAILLRLGYEHHFPAEWHREQARCTSFAASEPIDQSKL